MGDTKSYRELYDEVATLRGEMDDLTKRLRVACEQRDTWRAMHHEVEAERDRLQRSAERDALRLHFGDLIESAKPIRDRLVAAVESMEWVKYDDEELAFILALDALGGETFARPESALRSAATRVVQLIGHGADGLVVGEAIAEMRRVLDGGGQ
jgi:hypothetical protein